MIANGDDHILTYEKTLITNGMRVPKTSVIPGEEWQAKDSVSRGHLQCSHMFMELLHLGLYGTLLNKWEMQLAKCFLHSPLPAALCHVVA